MNILLLLILIVFNVVQCNVIKKLNRNPEESDHFEGDILKEPLFDGLIAIDKKWPNGTVPYEFGWNYPESAISQVKRAFKQFEMYTCIRFKKRETTDKDYIVINDSYECSSFIGRKGGLQYINLNSVTCIRTGTIIHELMHALGFFHEQSRKDRDKYVNIIWDNIDPDYQDQFEISSRETSNYATSYNPKSVMHYPFNAFSKSPHLTTIVAKDKSIKWNQVGQRINFSASDILQINRMYNCSVSEIFNFELNMNNE